MLNIMNLFVKSHSTEICEKIINNWRRNVENTVIAGNIGILIFLSFHAKSLQERYKMQIKIKKYVNIKNNFWDNSVANYIWWVQ